jgi:RNA polymerase sigma factor (sigma-70 family)
MDFRWLTSPRASAAHTPSDEAPDSETAESWRTWLITGTRRQPFDRRRVRGANRGLKRMLVEGTVNGTAWPAPWRDFSTAIIRQAVGEAMFALSAKDRQAVKMAYFGGLTNEEIAKELDMSVGSVRRRLRDALATLSRYVERGRIAGRSLVMAVSGWLVGRNLADGAHRPVGLAAEQLMGAGVVAAVAAAVLISQSASPAPTTHFDSVRNAPTVAQPAAAPTAVPEAPVDVPTAQPLPAAPSAIKVPGLPITIPVPSPTLPALPSPLPKLP